MKPIFLLASAAALAGAGVAIAQPAAQPRDRNADVTRQQVIERVDQRFQRLDANNDGRFTREEAQAHRAERRARRAERMFARLDADGDGSISREEFAAGHARRVERGPGMRGGHRMAMHHRRGPGRAMMGGRLFGEQGFVTLEQMRERALARFDRLDVDRNGTVTAEERREARQQLRERFRQHRRSDG